MTNHLEVVDLWVYSEAPIALNRDHVYENDNDGYKPRGLWLSVGDDWARWCIGERFHLDGLNYRQRVHLAPTANVLTITTDEQLLDFTHTHGKPIRDGSPMWFIDWPGVAAKYDGTLIAPYLWNMRLDVQVSWYYGWDCASACIWNLDAVDRIDPPPDDRLKMLPHLNNAELDVLAAALARHRLDLDDPETERIVMSLQTAIAEARHH